MGRTTPSLRLTEPLLADAPAPSGTLFVLGERGGLSARPSRAQHLTLGRNAKSVDVTIGGDDAKVSRVHATVRCMTQDQHSWWILRNMGQLPIFAPNEPPLLQSHELVLPPGYTPLHIQGQRLHLVEVLISVGQHQRGRPAPTVSTVDNRVELKPRELLVLVVMFQDYLRQSTTAHPLTWRETCVGLNQIPGEGDWNSGKAQHVVEAVRYRLDRAGIAGMVSETAHPDTLKHNLIRYLLATGTLRPDHLALLGAEDAEDEDSL